MNITMINKRLLPTLTLACLVPLVPQTAEANASFSSFATVTYTISSLSNSANSTDYSGLGIAGSFELAPDQAFQTINGDGSVTASATDPNPTALTPAIGSTFTRTFQVDGSASNSGDVSASYLAWFALAFENLSGSSSYDIGLTMSYQLSSIATGDTEQDTGFTDAALSYYNESGTFFGDEWAGAATPDLGTGYLQNTKTFNFTLAPGGTESLYVDARITGALQASPVPVPSAVWLFASAVLAMPGIKKFKRVVI